ncbi:unnamed protein product [Angiostrongylus costaricensis]|uniref:TSP1_spondin domain-containing protein n=1 Tax=Angiostrongylus costaricensis TaxID=334426 RepID=A0A158PEZ1_ANGCS|nr:unnamed protein product [Angiostrongylus costaricensis]
MTIIIALRMENNRASQLQQPSSQYQPCPDGYCHPPIVQEFQVAMRAMRGSLPRTGLRRPKIQNLPGSTKNGDCLRRKLKDALPQDLYKGPQFESAPCNLGVCQTWSDWCEWSTCSGSCGIGERTRTRFCYLETLKCEGKDFEQRNKGCGGCRGEGLGETLFSCFFGDVIQHSQIKVNVCDPGPCPEWEEWNEWSSCSTSCGVGVSLRRRSCLGGALGDNMCPGPSSEQRFCEEALCPLWTSWAEWSACSVTCDVGTRHRHRTCQYGTDCRGPQKHGLSGMNGQDVQLNVAQDNEEELVNVSEQMV